MALQDIQVPLGSGMNDTIHESALGDGESPLVKNAIPRGNQWDCRKGAYPIQTIPSSLPLLNLFAWRTNTDTDYLLGAGYKSGVAKQSGSGWVGISQQGVVLTSSDDRPTWQTIVKGLIAYGLRPGMLSSPSGVGRLYHITRSRITRAGTLAPGFTATVTNAVGGSLPVGTWLCGYKYVLDANTADETESDMTGLATVTTALNDQRVWTILAASHPRCNKIRCFVSRNEGAVLFRIAEISNANDTFTESVAEDDYGDEAILGLSGPPTNPLGLAVWDGVLWTHDGNDLWHSEPGRSYEEFDPLKSFKINRPPNTPSQFRGILAWDGSRLAVGMDYSLHYLVRDQASLVGYRVEDVTSNIGVAGANAMCVLEGTLFWYSGTQVWATTGGTPTCISDKRVERTLRSIPDAYRDRVMMTADETNGRVLMSFPTGGTDNDLMLAFSVRDGKWAIHTYFKGDPKAPHWMGYVPAAPESFNSGLKYLGATFFQGPNLAFSLERPFYRDRDHTGPTLIRQEFITKAVHAEGMALCVRRMRLAVAMRSLDDSVAALPNSLPGIDGSISVTVSLRLDGNRETASKTFNMSQKTEWVAVNLDNMDDPARTVAAHIAVESDSNAPITTYGLVLETKVLKARIGTAV